jgi:hypothetical protein
MPIDVILCAFPDVRVDHAVSRATLGAACAATGCLPQLDAEPRDGTHYTELLLGQWMRWSSALSLTSTRSEVLKLGKHNRKFYGQLEQLDSTNTVAQALSIFCRYTDPESVVLVTGDFDMDDASGQRHKRTLDEQRRDLSRCEGHAKDVGEHALWSAGSMDDDEAAMYAEWSARTGVSLTVYCSGHDVMNPQDTVKKLRRCGARRAIAMVEGIVKPSGSHRLLLSDVVAFVTACRT